MSVFDPIASWLHGFRLHSLLFEVTPRCNQGCPHCYNVWKGDAAYGKDELPTHQAQALIRKAIGESRCRQFTFTGGEPTLRGDLEELVSTAASRCDHVLLITNGTQLNQTRIASLVRAGVSLFELPLNGSDAETHDRMAGLSGAFDKVTRTALEIRSQGSDLAFVFVATKDNIHQWPEALDLGIALGARSFLFNRYNAGGTCHKAPQALFPDLDQLKTAFEIAEDRAQRFHISISAGVPIQPCLMDTTIYPHVGFGYCAAGGPNSYTTLDPMGNVRPCNHSGLHLGSLFETSLREMLQTPEFKTFHEDGPEFCSGCSRRRECQGGCKAAAEVCCGDREAMDPFLAWNQQHARPFKD